jgi:RNA polymerase sigma factor (sigma-70 family)
MEKLNFNKVYNENYSKVYNRVNQLVKNTEISKDLTSEIFMKVSDNLQVFDCSKAKLNTWILTITNNHCTDYFRKAKNSRNVLKVDNFVDSEGKEFFQFADSNNASDNVENNELKARIDNAFNSLKPEFKQVANLLFVEGKTYDEIVNLTGLSLSNVKVIIHRVKATLQTSLQAEYASL